MTLRVAMAVLLLVSLMVAGCSKKPKGPPRLKTTPVSGTVQVDGEPAEFLMVECHPDAGTSEMTTPVFATTDDKGEFSIATYEKDDGLPVGIYSLVFKWPGKGYTIKEKKDRLKDFYSDPRKSKIKVTVVEGEPNDLGIIELSTKGPGK